MQKILNIEHDAAVKAFNNADPAGKKMLSDLFGAKVLQVEVTKRVKTYEDACKELGTDPSLCADFDSDDAFAYHQLKTMAKALNEGWTPNWNDDNEYKYYPYFDLENGFSFFVTGCDYSSSVVGSRLCFRSSELAEYAGKQFLDIYKSFMVL